jgi:virulence-associated protein VapD
MVANYKMLVLKAAKYLSVRAKNVLKSITWFWLSVSDIRAFRDED